MSQDPAKRKTIIQPGPEDDEDNFVDDLLGKQRGKIHFTIRKGLSKVDPIQKRKTLYNTTHRHHKTMNDGRSGGAATRWKDEDENQMDVKAHIRDTEALLDTTEMDRLVGTGVTTLIIEDDENRLKVIPREVTSIQTLRSLSMMWTKVKIIPVHMFQMKLVELYIKESKLKKIDGIHGMYRMEKLELSNGCLEKLPLEIGEMVNLTTLDLTANKLKMIPASIGNLQKLDTLRVCGNKLTMLPATVTSLTKLHTLDASHNQIKEIPEDIGVLTNLVNFRMSQNCINHLPPSMKELTNLRNLYLGCNAFTDVPTELGYLNNLITLNLNGNSIREVTTPLPHIKTLLLDRNIIDVLRGPMFGCVNLEKLSLQYNKLTTIPPDIKKLKKLRALYLGGNDIEDLPDELCDLKELRHLNMRETQIQELPAHFDSLRKLSVIDIDETKLNLQYMYALKRDGVAGLRDHVRVKRGSISNNSTSPDDDTETDEEMPDVDVQPRQVNFKAPMAVGKKLETQRSPRRTDIISMWPDDSDSVPLRPTSNSSDSGLDRRKDRIKSMYPMMEPLSHQEHVWSPNSPDRQSGMSDEGFEMKAVTKVDKIPTPDYSDSEQTTDEEEETVEEKKDERKESTSSLVDEVFKASKQDIPNAAKENGIPSPTPDENDSSVSEVAHETSKSPKTDIASKPQIKTKPDRLSSVQSNGSVPSPSLLRQKDDEHPLVQSDTRRVSGPKPGTAPKPATKPRPDSGVPKPPVSQKPSLAPKPMRPLSEITE